MIRFECDFCQRLKRPGESWILGFGAENIGVTAARREITIASAWDDRRAVEYLALHFCSDPCRRKYVNRLFGEEPPQAEIVEEISVVPQKRVVRVFPGAKVETRVSRRTARTSKSKRKRKTA